MSELQINRPQKIAVILFNLGGPDGRESIRPFLYNFFTDPNIFTIPAPFRQMLAWLVAKRRTGKEAGTSYALLGYQSPLLANTRAQSDALQAVLDTQNCGNETYKCFVCMRYWHPLADDVAHQVKNFAPDRIVLLPLYPQYSTTTTRSSFQSWDTAAKKAGITTPVSAICCYPLDDGFIAASAESIREGLAKAHEQADGEPVRLLFSAHGLPETIIAKGDPYQGQCERTAQANVDRLAIPGLDWQICYQSRVGPLKWIGPSTLEALEKAAADRVGVVIYPHAFVSEHVETLVEIDIEYRHLAEGMGLTNFVKAQTVSTADSFIAGLANIVVAAQPGVTSNEGQRICPSGASKCCMQDKTAFNR